MKRYVDFSEARVDGLTIGKDCVLKGSYIEVEQDGTKIDIGSVNTFSNAHITVMRGGELTIGNLCTIRGRIIVGEDCKLNIGNGLSCNSSIKIHIAEKGSVFIGSDCLFANPQIFNSDMHSIFSDETGKRINKAMDVFIGDRVWVATNSLILKGANISNDSVVGAGSIVTGSFESNAIIAGNPAKVVKNGISWSRTMIDSKGISFCSGFSASEYRKQATEFNHEKVIEMGINYINQWESMDVNNYYVFYYLARSLLVSKFNINKSKTIICDEKEIDIFLIKLILEKCYHISGFKNLICGSYYYMSLNIIGEIEESQKIYKQIHSVWPQIDNERFHAKWRIDK